MRHPIQKTLLTCLRDRRAWLVALAAALIWIVHFDRWTLASWRIPTDYYVDAHETLARLKAASEGDGWPLRAHVVERLGAPFGAHWNAYPAPDKLLMLALGGLVHLIGLYAAANVGYLLAQVTAALAFYLTARWLRCRWEWAAAGALLFAYTYHTFHRGLAHFSLVFTWTIPLGLAAVWLVAQSRRVTWRRPAAAACLLAAVALGCSNPYNLFFWLQLMAWALVWQWCGARRRENLQIGFATIGTALAAFAVMHLGGWLHVENPDAVPLLARNYGGTEVYALKPVEMFIPPPFHHWDWLAFFGNRYARWSVWRGEVFLPYLGMAGIAGFIWLMLATVRRMVARRAPPGQALSIAWILSYATIGGLTNVLALFAGFLVFRATNRAAVFVSALVLFFLMGRLSRLSLKWPAWLRAGAAAALAAIGVFEQLPKPEGAAVQAELAADVRADEQFGQMLEKELPRGAMVFQLPVLGFPEVQAPHRLGDYEHFRPYLATETLRFSYGAPKARSRSRWQRELEGLSVAQLVPQLEDHGFAALYLNRKGFADAGAQILAELTALGYTQRLQSPGGNQVVIKLHPAADPAPPLAQSPTYGRGWQLRADNGWFWAYEDAALSYYNPYSSPITVSLRMTLMGATPREVILDHDGESLGRVSVGTTPTPMELSQVQLAPGVNRFKLRCPQGAVRQGAGRNQLRSFGVHGAEVSIIPGDATAATVKRPPRRPGRSRTTSIPTAGGAAPITPSLGSVDRVAGAAPPNSP